MYAGSRRKGKQHTIKQVKIGKVLYMYVVCVPHLRIALIEVLYIKFMHLLKADLNAQMNKLNFKETAIIPR